VASQARMTGALYLLYFLTTILGMLLVSRGFAVSGNALMTSRPCATSL